MTNNSHPSTQPDSGSQARFGALIAGWLALSTAATIGAALLTTGCGTRASAPSELRVTSHSPDTRAAGAEDLPIRIVFSRPVVAEEKIGVALEVPPVTIAPAAAIRAHWQDRQTLVVTPNAELAPSTRYRVSLRDALLQQAGAYSFEFVHRPLEVEGIWGPVDIRNLSSRPVLPLHFNQKVTTDAVTRHCSLAPAAGGDPISLRLVSVDDGGTKVILRPDLELDKDARYSLRCSGLAGAGGDTPLAETYLLDLHTHPAFAVLGTDPSDVVGADDVSVEIKLATPVKLEQLRKHLTAKPRIASLLQGSLDATGTTYTVTTSLPITTRFRVRIMAGLTDVYGQRLAKDRTFAFTTSDAKPRISMETGIYAVEAGSAGYPVWTRNVRKYKVECAAVPRSKIVKVLTTDVQYSTWAGNEDENDIDFASLGLRSRTRTVRIKRKRNKWRLGHLGLGTLCKPKSRRGKKHGVYLAEVWSDDAEQGTRRVLANVTDLGVVLKAAPAKGLIWVTRISTGAPVPKANVTLYSPQGKRVFRGKTDSRGLLELPGSAKLLPRSEDERDDEYSSNRSQRMIAVVEKSGDMAVTDGNWADGIQTWNFGVTEDRRGGRARIRGFIQSDRGIYRPGEKVHFKGLAREIRVGRAPSIPKNKTIRVHIEDGRGSTVMEKKLRLSKFGGFGFDLGLEKSASLGDYYVIATIGKQSFRERFMVEEFRKVTYEVGLRSAKRHGRLGDKLVLDLDARYLFGAPVNNAKVEWNVQRREHTLRFPKFSAYGFVDYPARGIDWWYGVDTSERYANYLQDGAGKTNSAGRFRFNMRDQAKKLTGPQDYIVSASVTDQTDQTISKSMVVTAHKSDFYLGLHSREFVQAVGKPFVINTVAVDPSGKRVAVKNATLSYLRQDYVCKSQGGYRSYSRCTTKHRSILTRAISIPETGTGAERITPTKPGEYIVRITGTDARGNKVSTATYVWVLGKGEAFWSGDESARMSLIASKASYRPGDTARLVPRTNMKNAWALISIERNGVIDAQVKQMSNANEGIELAIKNTYGPNVFASVAMVSGRQGKGDNKRPRFKMGLVELKVSTKHNKLMVAVETDKATYQPGETVTATIKVSKNGEPVTSEVSLSVADEGVLQLIAYKTPNPMNTFYKSWGLGVDSATNWNRIARVADPSEYDPDEGGDSSDGSTSKVRSKFVSSAFWASALRTDEHGLIKVTFKAPDNLTAFRLMAVAADAGHKFGSGDRRITIAKPLLAKAVLPRFVTEGDLAEVGVMVHNYTGAAGKVDIVASARGAWLGRKTRTIELAEGASKRVRFYARVAARKEARFAFAVTMGKYSDALAVTLPINRPLIVEKRTLGSGKIIDGTVSVPLAFAKELDKRGSEVVVTVDRTGMAELEPSLRYLVEYPYGCLEQTLSRFIPLAKVKDLSRTVGLRSLRGPRLRSFIRAGAAKVVRHQHGNGHFSLWPSGPTYPHLTVYAIYGLLEAKRSGVAVDARAVANGIRALQRWISKGSKAGPGGDGATAAMAAYVLAWNGKADTSLNAKLFAARRGLPRYGQAFLLRALHAAKADASQIATLTQELLGAMTVTGDTAVVGEKDSGLRWYMSSDTRSTAITLAALLEVAPKNAAIEKLVEGLKRKQKPGGHWANTQDNLYALVAMADYARRQASGSAKVTIRLDGKKLVAKTLEGSSVLRLRRSLRQIKAGTLTIQSSGMARYAVRLKAARKLSKNTPQQLGFEVTRAYLHPRTNKPLGRVRAGQLVKIRVTVATKVDRQYVAVVDPLPAGFEAVNTRLATSGHRSGASSYNGSYYYGWTHQEMRDDRVLGFADRMRKGQLVLEYTARATIPGTFIALPAHAEAMYQPDVRGRSVARTWVIKQ